MPHYHANLRLSVFAESRDELLAEISLAAGSIDRVCQEAADVWDLKPTEQGISFADPTLSGGVVVGVLCRHTDPKEN
jgi:hypothetical protein